MANYCIVAANHENPNSHVASSFDVYMEIEKNNWHSQAAMSAKQVVELIEKKNSVRTGKIEDGELFLGAPVEVELRIAKNQVHYPISEMPEF